jgi:alpha-glucosidase
LDTRYYITNDDGGLVPIGNAPNTSAYYTSFTHGVYLRNSHAQEIRLNENNVTWRTLGGSVDLFIYSGSKPADVIRSYQQSAVGLPVMQNYWALGFHQCRWGYENWTVVQDVVDNFERFGIPLETMWSELPSRTVSHVYLLTGGSRH